VNELAVISIIILPFIICFGLALYIKKVTRSEIAKARKNNIKGKAYLPKEFQ